METTEILNETATPSIFSDKKSPIRGEGYAMVHTPDLIKAFTDSGLMPVWAKQRVSRAEENRKYSRHMIRFRRAGQEMMLDELYPEVVLINAHDGSSSVNLMAGMFRTICANGLIVATSTYGQETIRHSRKTAAADAIEAAHRMIQCAEASESIVKNMMQKHLSHQQQLKLANSGHQLRFGPKNTELSDAVNPDLFLAAIRPEDEGPSLWNTFNRIQENMIRGGGIQVNLVNSFRRRKLVKLKEISGISQSMDMNKGLWGAAMLMLDEPNEWYAEAGLTRGLIES